MQNSVLPASVDSRLMLVDSGRFPVDRRPRSGRNSVQDGRARGPRTGRGERMRRVLIAAFAALFALAVGGSSATAVDLPLPLDKRSGFYSFATFTEPLSSGFGGPGFGTIAGTVCTSTTATEPAIFAGNFLLDCDTGGPHNETTIAVNPTNASNVIGGSHSFLLTQQGGTLIAHIVGIPYVTTDGGATWANVHMPLGSYQFTGDPAVAFDAAGRAYFANLGDHEGQAGAFTNVSVIVQRSDDGGLDW